MLDSHGLTTTRMFFREGVARAVREEMTRDPRILIMGQDVGAFGGSYREFDGLYPIFGPGRIRDTPVAEAATIGIAAGAAAAGYRPLVSITYMDFLMLGFDALINYAAKLRYKSAGTLTAPLVVKTTAGAHGQGVAHSQCIEAWLMSVPGLTVVAPATPADAYGLMKTALRHDGPVVYIDHKRLFPAPGEVPVIEEPVPFGQACVRRTGRDVTLVTHGYMVQVALEAARALEYQDISCEVIDLRSLAPLDIGTVTASVARTGRLLTLEEGQTVCGVGAEVASQMFERIGPRPWIRIGALPAPVSSNPVLETACVPDAARVARTVCALMAQ
ncbi:Transketolase central region [Gluconacetobacter diazotrophicus PA1 5]|uniref:2-oxoglutarate dehydrogenase n=2 Tax=Gluconacetobacter diazotrophicus TaxID=33996 RepID=A0A7W4I4A2_GLUDI|nr:transketolase C-terminal domain-containing protein [Gluconacetobacter diazotrophicus]ACI50539.1 Transketolase central region [Gluconacetobacter diazotrophicus PA1 5]MBB2155732.1 2-oxoglutarate dehydrogenase [Gluconacetobacter diazotrophicus]TWB09371.1 pyruvate dehydrogenase E1 component beta subunit [Gluconacetobacter diazotrophicus]CAP56448.1 putative 2-oxoglutarate dehydrogenase E1 component beta subunit [Gluconacetobacter diazotrophicus PA1 5]